jgi:hypothetical protein
MPVFLPTVRNCHWYKWFNNPWRGIEDIISGDNFGLIDFDDEPYETFISYIREVNHRVEEWHIGIQQ